MTLNNQVLQRLRKNAMYSQETMSDLMGIDPSTYNRLENGKIKLKMEHVSKLAKALEKKEDEIFEQLRGCVFHNSINDTVQNSQNQNVVINFSEKELLQQLLAEKNQSISNQAETIKSQATTIALLQGEIMRLKKV
jgi:transcriptional regulator with XRE-family HTH domain